MYNINDKNTQSVAESVKEVIENKKDFKPHMMYDPKTGKGYEAKTYEDHLKMKDMGYTHEKPSKKNETEVQDSDKDFVDTHTVDAKEDPEKKRQVEEKEEDDDVEEGNAFGQAVTDAKKAGKKKFKFQGKEYKVESVDLEEATMSQGVKTAQTQIYSLEKSLKVGSNLNKGVNKSLEGKYDADFKKMQKAIGQIINVWEEIERDFAMNESAELEEALKPADFVKGGNAKVTKREVDGMLSKLFIDSKLAKAVEANAAYQDGYKGKVKKNPFDKDTADFHLFILGQQSADAE